MKRSRIGRVLAPLGSRRRGLVLLGQHGIEVIRHQGIRTFWSRLRQKSRWSSGMWKVTLGGLGYSIDDQYQRWLERQAPIAPPGAEHGAGPLISLVMPAFDSEPGFLRAAVRSVLAQTYGRWELCIVDDGSRRDATLNVLEELAGLDPRIKLDRLAENRGISAASNRALELATGEFVGLLDHDDELKPGALAEVCSLLDQKPDLDYIYTDEDHRDETGRLIKPFFKPGWSPELLMSINYCGHFSVYRRSFVEQLGGFREGYEGSQDHDLVLRATEASSNIAHIPGPQYTWRMSSVSQSGSIRAKPYVHEAGERALADALARRGENGTVEKIDVGRYRVRYSFPETTAVSIIIPTRDRVDLLERCINSVRKKTAGPRYELVVVDNESVRPETHRFLASADCLVVRAPGPFNFSAMLNRAAAETRSDALVFLNNDTEVIADGWLEALLEQGCRPEIGAVGARLVYPTGRSQHEGIVLGLRDGLPGNVDHRGYFRLGDLIGNVAAVSAACMLTRRSVFAELGGFDEDLGVAFNDVDYCLRARAAGYRVVYTPFALLYHHEGATRGTLHPSADEQLFRQRWGDETDPYYNPYLSRRQAYTLEV